MKVELQNIERSYMGKKVLDINALTLESGKIYAVVGPNGSGKTTLLRILAGQDRDYKGRVLYNGVEGANSRNISRNIAYMPQNSYMFDLTVMENMLLGLKNKGMNTKDAKEKAKEALTSVGMESFINVRAPTLSGGEAQRVALARTLVLERSLVILDEPASATDLLGVELVEEYIKSTNRKNGSTVVFSTHSPSVAVHIADEVVMMYKGKVLEQGSPKDVFYSPKCQETRDFLRSWRI